MALTKPFAENGDKKAIPQTTSDGSVSFNNGFGSLYALPPEEGGLFIDRAQFNQLMFDTTSQILENKTAIATKANDNSVVKLTGNQTIQGVKTFSSPPVSATNPTANNQVANKAYVDSVGNTKANANATVNLTGNQTIAGVKTFSSPVVVPNATANTHAVNLAQLNTKANQDTTYTKTEVNNLVNAKANANATVNLTGNQTIKGVKTFSSVPVCATAPTANNHLVNKGYIDSIAQVPDYSAAINITPNKAFTPNFNGVVEIGGNSVVNNWDIIILIGTNLSGQAILGGSMSYAGQLIGQAIIVKGQTYYFHTKNIANLYRAIICPFKGVKQ